MNDPDTGSFQTEVKKISRELNNDWYKLQKYLS